MAQKQEIAGSVMSPEWTSQMERGTHIHSIQNHQRPFHKSSHLQAQASSARDFKV